MNKFIKKDFSMITIIGTVFAKGKAGLVYGESGIGKSTSTIQLLNEDGIVPILVDFDDNPSPEEMGVNHIPIDGYALVKELYKGDTTNIDVGTSNVFILDTYAYSRATMQNTPMEDFQSLIDMLLANGDNTVIILAHNKDIATKKDIPDVDEVWANHLGFKLWIHEALVVLPGDKKKTLVASMTVKKLRGYKGPRDIVLRVLSPNEE